MRRGTNRGKEEAEGPSGVHDPAGSGARIRTRLLAGRRDSSGGALPLHRVAAAAGEGLMRGAGWRATTSKVSGTPLPLPLEVPSVSGTLVGPAPPAPPSARPGPGPGSLAFAAAGDPVTCDGRPALPRPAPKGSAFPLRSRSKLQGGDQSPAQLFGANCIRKIAAPGP